MHDASKSRDYAGYKNVPFEQQGYKLYLFEGQLIVVID